MKTELEIGDVIYDRSTWHGLNRYVINKLTPKQAVSGSTRFNRAITGKTLNVIGGGWAYLETDELKAEYILQTSRRNLRETLRNINPDKLNQSEINSIIEALNRTES